MGHVKKSDNIYLDPKRLVFLAGFVISLTLMSSGFRSVAIFMSFLFLAGYIFALASQFKEPEAGAKSRDADEL
jgi:hypothetical protein